MQTLYVVATPIGNLSDLSPRSREVLSSCGLVVAEDTRHTRGLLSHIGVSKPMESCHKFNEAQKAERIVARMQNEGFDSALVSDAGTPCISDPGYRLVAAAHDAGVEVVGVSGPSAVITALSVSGFDIPAFSFLGFAPRGENERGELWTKQSAAPEPVFVLYESPKRVISLLRSLAAAFPDARVCTCCDLTKKFEKTRRGPVFDILAALEADSNAGLGEYVVIVEKNLAVASVDDGERELTFEARLTEHMARGATLREAREALILEGARKNEVYAAALRLKAMFA